MPKIMHWLNWYTAMCFNRMLNRKGHFWEERYHSTGFHKDDKQRALNTLRYIHANPKAAGMRKGFFYTFSNYSTYDTLTDDGLTQWHPAVRRSRPLLLAFFSMGKSLDDCADRYRNFCLKYTPPKKQPRQYHWGSRLLVGMEKPRRGQTYSSPGQMNFALSARYRKAQNYRQLPKPSLMQTVSSQLSMHLDFEIEFDSGIWLQNSIPNGQAARSTH